MIKSETMSYCHFSGLVGLHKSPNVSEYRLVATVSDGPHVRPSSSLFLFY